MLVFTWVAGLIGGVVKIVANITENQRAYLDWRLSDDGKRYFSAQEQNDFWKALASGNTQVIDSGIKYKQDKINDMRKRIGLRTITMFCLCITLCAGCRTYTIPATTPLVAVEALTSNEVTYVANNMRIETPEGKAKVLEGNWHIVSADFIKLHVRNQDDLIQVMDLLQKQRDNNRVLGILGWVLFVAAMILMFYVVISRLRSGR